MELGNVKRLVECAYNAVVALRQGVLDVVERGVDKNASVVPATALDADRLMDHGELLQLLVGNNDGWEEMWW